MKKIMLSLLSLVIVASVLAGCQSGRLTSGDNKDIAKIIYHVGESFDTSINYIAASWVTVGVAETLFTVDEKGTVVPLLAESCEKTDDLHWTLKLKKDIKFHDGEPMNADAVIFSLGRLNEEGQFGGNFDFITKLEKVDDDTINITTNEPYGSVSSRLCEYKSVIVSPKNDFETTLYGTGPFKFVSTEPDVKTVVARNDNYWGGVPKLAGAEFYVVEDKMTGTYMLYNNEVDYTCEGIPVSELENVKTQGHLESFEVNNGYTHVMMLNTKKGALADPNVRQALSYAINREELVKTIFEGVKGEPTSGFITDESPWANSIMKKYEYNPTKALELLKEAGIEDTNSDKVLEYQGQPFTLNLMTYETALYKHAVEVLQAQLKEIGILVNLEVTTWDVTDKKMTDKNYDINFDSSPFLEFGNPISLENNFGSKSYPAIATAYNNPEMDELLGQGSKAFGDEERKNIYDNVQELALKDMPVISVYEGVELHAMNKRLKNFDINPYMVSKITKNTAIEE